MKSLSSFGTQVAHPQKMKVLDPSVRHLARVHRGRPKQKGNWPTPAWLLAFQKNKDFS